MGSCGVLRGPDRFELHVLFHHPDRFQRSDNGLSVCGSGLSEGRSNEG